MKRAWCGASAVRWVVALALVSAGQPGWAAKCTISSAGVNFGSYNALSSLNTDSSGSIDVDCNGQRVPHEIALSQGFSGSFSPRAMYSIAPRTLEYNLYTNAPRTTVWGDGTAGTSIVSGVAVTASYTVYGRIPARQNAWVGNYYDFLTITVTF